MMWFYYEVLCNYFVITPIHTIEVPIAIIYSALLTVEMGLVVPMISIIRSYL